MKQEDLLREMAAVMGQLSLDQQRQLLALARTLREAERALPKPADEGDA